jgi:hypothetical protein
LTVVDKLRFLSGVAFGTVLRRFLCAQEPENWTAWIGTDTWPLYPLIQPASGLLYQQRARQDPRSLQQMKPPVCDVGHKFDHRPLVVFDQQMTWAARGTSPVIFASRVNECVLCCC